MFHQISGIFFVPPFLLGTTFLKGWVLTKVLTNGNFHELLIWPKIIGKVDNYIESTHSLLLFLLYSFLCCDT